MTVNSHPCIVKCQYLAKYQFGSTCVNWKMEINLCSKRGKYDTHSLCILFKNPLFILQYIQKKKEVKQQNKKRGEEIRTHDLLICSSIRFLAPHRSVVHSADMYLLIYKREHELGQVMRKCVLWHMRSLISTFVVRCLDSMTCILAPSKRSRF